MRRPPPRGERLCDVGEDRVLQSIHATLHRASRGSSGVGDDAALLRIDDANAVVSTDMLVQDVDFRLAWARFADVGAKAAMVNLSDVAAMGATPRALLVSIAAPRQTRYRDVVALVRTADAVGRSLGAPVVGGDLSETCGPLVVSVTALGHAQGPVWRRHQGQLGDVVCVTGTLGAAAAGLCVLETPSRFATLAPRARAQLVRAQLRPHAPVALAPRLAALNVVHSAADLSDGLLRDGLHVAPPRAGIVLDVTRLPLSPAVWAAARCLHAQKAHARAQAYQWALGGGEDFGLVVALAPVDLARAQRVCQRFGVALTPVGRVRQKRGMHVWPAAATKDLQRGFLHFATSIDSA